MPDQGSYIDAGLSDIDDGLLGLGSTPLSDRYKTRFQDWRAGSYSISSALRARSQRGLRLGRQFSVSSDLPTSDPLLSRASLYHYDQPAPHHHQQQLLSAGGPLGGIGGTAAARDHDLLLLHSRISTKVSTPLVRSTVAFALELFGR